LFLRLIPFLVAGVVTWLLLRGLIPQLRQRLLDQPNARSSHRQPTPRGGGVAFVLVAVVASLLALGSGDRSTTATLPLIALPLALVGFLDDRHNLPASWRYGVQLATALGLILLSPLPFPWLALPLLLIAATAVINFTNFMDGLDGLVAGCIAVALSALSIKLSAPWPLWALVGALLGFLLWNWNPAKVFMGDVGSTFLGAVFAGLVLQAPSWPETLGSLLVATPLLADACLCVPRRLLAGQPVFQAHRLHLFQRLHQGGWSHGQVASLYIAATTASAVALLWSGWPAVLTLAAVELLVGVWLDRCVAVPFATALAGTGACHPAMSD
jgi:Fuc2NAc and GlcNAc transferase